MPFPNLPLPNDVGIGLRHPHYQYVAYEHPDVAWFEVHAENFFHKGGITRHILEEVRARYPLSIHGVGLSLGSAGALDKQHLKQLKELVDYVQPQLVSEHVSWSSAGGNGVVMNDLLPIPYTKESVNHLAHHIEETQNILGREILIENPSSYLCYQESEMEEYEFMKEVAQKSGCFILLDVNNIYVTHHNHGVDLNAYLDTIPKDKVKEIHLAGYAKRNIEDKPIYIDHHGDYVSHPVWNLYKQAIKQFGKIPTLIEWDTDIPEFSVLQEEAKKARTILNALRDA